jgi:predicted transcriptional regulator
MKKDPTTFTFRCPEPIAKALRERAKAENKGRSVLMIEALERYLGMAPPASAGISAIEVLERIGEIEGRLVAQARKQEERLDRLTEEVTPLERRVTVLEHGSNPDERQDRDGTFWYTMQQEAPSAAERRRAAEESERSRERKANAQLKADSKLNGMLKSVEAYRQVAILLGLDPTDLKGRTSLPTGEQFSFRIFCKGSSPEHFRRFGFEPDFAMRELGYWLTPIEPDKTG